MVFQYTQTTELVECYFFGGYSYYGNPCLFRLRDHPDPILGGNFADDEIPSILDQIAGYGSLGLDTPGEVVCPDIPIPPIGACCIDSLCTVTTAEDCHGTWLGPDTDCDPNPCSPPQGACCINGECVVLSQPDCEEHDGQFIGQGVPCEPDPCSPNPTRTTTWGRIKHEHR